MRKESITKTITLILLASMGLLCADSTGAAPTYTVLHEFTGADGSQPYGGVVLGADGRLYGTTYVGGLSNCGTVFGLGSDGSGFTVLKSFTGGADGASPEAGVVLSGTTLYGTTCYGGNFGDGTIFTLNTDGSGHTVLKHFALSEGAHPSSELVLSGTKIYGAACYGKVFRMNTDGSGYNYTLIDAQGGIPMGGLLLSGSTLFGSEEEGGPSYGDGMVFRINTDGSGYSAVKVLGGTAGRWPRGKLELSGTTLYGAAYAGGSGCGTVFKANTDGSGFSVLKQFTGGLDGGYPCTGVALWGTTLYGTAARGGSSNKGTFFQLNTDGSNFTVLKSFTGNDGDYPFGNLLLSGATFYGTTVYGGTSNCGVVFACSLADPPVVRWLSPSRTAELGSTVRFAVRAEGSNPRMCQWFFNGTNALTGSTTDFSLTLTNLQAVQAGAYTVIVTNVAGAVTSSPALLSVIPPVQRAMVPGIHVTGDAGSSIQLDCSGSQTPPCYWWPLDSVDLSGASAYYFDLSTPLPAQRFYRTRQVGVPGVAPALGISLVPAVTLTGGVGSRVRLDGINAVGPTDAWFTVATVALTNTSQLYFDVSAASQPNRCYRVVPVP